MAHPSRCCFVINLDRSEARLRAITAQLNAARIEFSRFAAMDGCAIDPDGIPLFDRRAYELRHGKMPAPREIACFMSHIGVLRRFLNTGHEFCLVLEDDAIVEPSLARTLDGLMRIADRWDMVLLYGNHDGVPLALTGIDESHELVGYFTRQTGAVGYFINRMAATIYIRKLLPMTLPYDRDFDRAWDFGIKFRGIRPFPVRTGAHPSDIGPTGRKFPWYRRLGTFAMRGLTEIRRTIHYSLKDPIWLSALAYRVKQAPRARAGEALSFPRKRAA